MLSTLSSTSPQLLEALLTARARTDQLFGLLRPEVLYERPVNERHRLIFYVGHLDAFDWNQICRATLGMPSFHPEFDKLFEAGIDPEPGLGPMDQPADWPTLDEVLEYRAEVRRRLDAVIDRVNEYQVRNAIEHRYMHAETLAYLLHNLPFSHKWDGPAHDAPNGLAPAPSFVPIPEGVATLGQEAGGFGWDNEFREHQANVPAFRISKYKVTNGEYLCFVDSGAKAPHFWVLKDRQWYLRGMFDEYPLPLNWPVYVTQEEAVAYATWAGKSLMTEQQFHRAAYGTPSGAERQYPWENEDSVSGKGNFDFARYDPVPVHADPAGDSAFGVSQLVGNGWEWTSTEFGPFEGFQPSKTYPGYSANFFDGKHFVMKGASARTAACFLRRSFRNWFRYNYPYVYAGFRLVEN